MHANVENENDRRPTMTTYAFESVCSSIRNRGIRGDSILNFHGCTRRCQKVDEPTWRVWQRLLSLNRCSLIRVGIRMSPTLPMEDSRPRPRPSSSSPTFLPRGQGRFVILASYLKHADAIGILNLFADGSKRKSCSCCIDSYRSRK
ncbi:hypothetical protein CDAR_274341 [Caerostris darwini]|uniref:Uncharacterized protein n=1 Tax=Caerostris darwini TaxID=1538125 RepID=A0AAV4RDU1_9ARAC|nr:hypothetical protein CDAR_274341 [Caerostris darwini]